MLDLEFKLKPSFLYTTSLLVIILLSIAIFLLLPINIWLKFPGFILLSLYSLHIFWKFGLLRGRHAIYGFKYLNQHSFQIYTLDKIYVATLCGSSLVTRSFSVLRFQITESSWFKPSCIVFPDSLAPHLYRRLLIVLKLGPG